MASVNFNFYGLAVSVDDVRGGAGTICAALVEDFEYFFCEKVARHSHVVLSFEGELPVELVPKRRILFRANGCNVYGWGVRRRWCEYKSNHWIIHEFAGARRIRVYGKDAERLYEIAYLALLSVIGEELEARGYQRVHAVAFSKSKKTAVALLDSGQGKSSIATLLLQNTDAQIYSDEIALIHRGQVQPFPLRRALREESVRSLGLEIGEGRLFKRERYGAKYLFSLPKQRVGAPAKADLIFYGRAMRQPGRAHRGFDFKSATSMIVDMVLGRGLPQMAEHLLRLENAFRLAVFASRRLGLALNWVLMGDKYRLAETPDSRLLARAILDVVENKNV